MVVRMALPPDRMRSSSYNVPEGNTQPFPNHTPWKAQSRVTSSASIGGKCQDIEVGAARCYDFNTSRTNDSQNYVIVISKRPVSWHFPFPSTRRTIVDCVVASEDVEQKKNQRHWIF